MTSIEINKIQMTQQSPRPHPVLPLESLGGREEGGVLGPGEACIPAPPLGPSESGTTSGPRGPARAPTATHLHPDAAEKGLCVPGDAACLSRAICFGLMPASLSHAPELPPIRTAPERRGAAPRLLPTKKRPPPLPLRTPSQPDASSGLSGSPAQPACLPPRGGRRPPGQGNPEGWTQPSAAGRGAAASLATIPAPQVGSRGLGEVSNT